MRYLAIVFTAGFAVGLSAAAASAQDGGVELIDNAKSLFTRGEFEKALTKFKLAQQMKAGGEGDTEVALYIGAIHAEMDRPEPARENICRHLAAHPDAAVPEGFTEKMVCALESARRTFPIVEEVSPEKEAFKPYREKLGITFVVKADRGVLEKTSLTFRIIAAARGEVMLEEAVKLDASAHVQRILWDGRTRRGTFARSDDYVFVVEAVREDGWMYAAQCKVAVGGNMETPHVAASREKLARIEGLCGQRRADCIPEKKFMKVGEKPLKGSTKGMWNYVYYVCIGALRDGLDFPVKFLLSLKGVGHVLTVTTPFAGGYEAGRVLWKVDKKDYRGYDPVLGEWQFDREAYDKDRKVAEQRSLATGALGPVWAFAYAGVMSIVSWAGTDDGIAGGFSSYINSNAFRNGCDWKYFFPNYRSLDFSSVRVDGKALADMEAQVREHNQAITDEVDSFNRSVDTFNRDEMDAFRRAVAGKYSEKLHDAAEMTLRQK